MTGHFSHHVVFPFATVRAPAAHSREHSVSVPARKSLMRHRRQPVLDQSRSPCSQHPNIGESRKKLVEPKNDKPHAREEIACARAGFCLSRIRRMRGANERDRVNIYGTSGRRDVRSRSRANASLALVIRLQPCRLIAIDIGGSDLRRKRPIVGRMTNHRGEDCNSDTIATATLARALLFMTLISSAFNAASCSSCWLRELNDRYHSPLCNLRLLSVILVLCLSFFFILFSLEIQISRFVCSIVDAVLWRKVSRLRVLLLP